MLITQCTTEERGGRGHDDDAKGRNDIYTGKHTRTTSDTSV